jgi:hypothetical protein
MTHIIVEGYRYDLGKLYEVPNASTREHSGVKRVSAWITKSNRVIVETYSIWENRQTHGVEGTHYHIADEDEIARLADELGDERLLELVPMAPDA